MYLYNLDTEGLSDLLRNVRGSRVCNIKHFSIASHKESKALAKDVHALLTLPKTLRSVSLYWHNYKFKTGPAKKDVALKISNEQVWQALKQSSATLESLDIVHGFKAGRHNVTDHFGPLTSFTALKSIIIQVEVLLGYDDSSLLTCLPFTLEDLTLMIDTVRLPRLPKLFSQLSLLVSSTKRPSLKSLWLGGKHPSDFSPCRTEPAISDAYQNLHEICLQRAVSIAAVSYHHRNHVFSKGGRDPWIWRKTMYMMGTGFHRMQKVREKLQRRANDESTDSGGEEDRARTWQCHKIPFLDHRGETSYMVFEAQDPPRLPPLISCAFYFTHPDTDRDLPKHLDLVGLYKVLRDWCAEDFHIRLDVYFIPGTGAGSSESECIAHYRAEKAVRANSHEQMQESLARRRDATLPPLPRPLPGMVPEIRGFRRPPWEGNLCICPGRDWRDVDPSNAQTFSCVELGFLLRAGDGDAGGGGGPEPFGVFSQQFPLSGDTDATVAGYVWDMALHFEDPYFGPYQRAVRKGWAYW